MGGEIYWIGEQPELERIVSTMEWAMDWFMAMIEVILCFKQVLSCRETPKALLPPSYHQVLTDDLTLPSNNTKLYL